MTSESPAVLERLLRGNELGWMIDLYAPKDGAIPFLLGQLDAVKAEYRRRIGEDIPLTAEGLNDYAEANPHKIRAFLQALAITRSLEMLVMVWRILQGLTIQRVEMKYQALSAFSLEVDLATGSTPETYRSTDIKDAALLRNFGIGSVDGKPLFDGFFPLRKK
jgi:hypothetical protein